MIVKYCIIISDQNFQFSEPVSLGRDSMLILAEVGCRVKAEAEAEVGVAVEAEDVEGPAEAEVAAGMFREFGDQVFARV